MKQNKFLTLTVILLMLVSQLAVFEFVPTVKAQGWLTGWTYRKSHVINAASGAGTNYQVRIVAHYGSGTDSNSDVYLNSHCRTDFGDVRFTGSDGSTLLDYWMESYTAGDNAVFWVEVADDLSSNNATIYIYYGNPTATTTSNGDNTFRFFDDFSGTSIDWTNKWQSTNQTLYSIESGALKMTVGSAASQLLNTKNTYSAFRAVALIRQSVSGKQSYLLIEDSPATYTGYDISVLAWNIPEIDTMIGKVRNEYPEAQDLTSYYKMEWRCPSSGNAQLIVTKAGVTKVNRTGTPSYRTGYVSFLCWLSDGVGYVDNVYVTKYVSPEPAHGSWGSEETSSVTYQRSAGQTLTLQAVSSRQTLNQRSAVLSLQFLLQSSRQSSSVRLVNQVLFSVASATRQLTVVRTPEQQLPFLTETSRQTSYVRIFDQAVSFLQAVARQFTGFRTADQNFLILTETARSTSYQRTSSTALSIMADALRTLSTPRTASLQLTVLTEASRTATYGRTASQMLSTLTETARQLTLPRSPTQTLSILTATSRSQTLQRTTSQIVSVLLSATRQATYTRPVNQPLNFLTTSTIAKIFWRYASQVLTILTQTTRQLTLNRFAQQPLNILLSATRQASYRRTAEVLLQINTRTAIKFIIYVEVPTPTPTPTPVPLMPSIRLDAIIQTARITSLWWQRTTALEVLVINKGTVASDVTFEYTLLDQNNQIITQGTQAVFISGLDKKTVYVNIPTPPDGKYTIQFRTTQPVKVEVKSVVVVETPFYGKLTFSILIIFLLILTIYIIRRRRLSYS